MRAVLYLGAQIACLACLVVGCAFETTDFPFDAGAGARMDASATLDSSVAPYGKSPKPARCSNPLVGPIGFNDGPEWEPFVTGNGSIQINDGVLASFVPGDDALNVTGLQTVSSELSLKDRRFYTKILRIPSPFNNRSVRLDFINPLTGAFLMIAADANRVRALVKASFDTMFEIVGDQLIEDDYPYYIQIREEDDFVFFELGKTLESMTLFAVQELNTLVAQENILTSRIRIYTFENTGAVDPVTVEIEHFNLEPACR